MWSKSGTVRNSDFDRTFTNVRNGMSSTPYDIIIIGAGPAGSTCALALKKSGLRIALVDKSAFPRDKVCGDSVASTAKRILRKLDPDLEQQLLGFEAKSSINKAILFSPDFTRLPVQFRTVSHCIRRWDFDQWLLSKAEEQNPDLVRHFGNPVTAVERNGSSAAVTLGNGERLIAPVIIACDGVHSIVGKTFAGHTMDREHFSGAVRQYFENVSGLRADTSEVFFLKDYLPGYFWIFPLDGNAANVGFGMLSSTIAERRIDLRKSLERIIRETPELRERFASATPLGPIRGSGLPLGSRLQAVSGDRFMLCGDAAGLVDPFSGEGIAPAMQSGVFAAEQAMECFRTQRFDAEAMKGYERRIRTKYQGDFRYHYWLQHILSDRTRLIDGLFKLLRIPFINRRVARLFY